MLFGQARFFPGHIFPITYIIVIATWYSACTRWPPVAVLKALGPIIHFIKKKYLL